MIIQKQWWMCVLVFFSWCQDFLILIKSVWRLQKSVYYGCWNNMSWNCIISFRLIGVKKLLRLWRCLFVGNIFKRVYCFWDSFCCGVIKWNLWCFLFGGFQKLFVNKMFCGNSNCKFFFQFLLIFLKSSFIIFYLKIWLWRRLLWLRWRFIIWSQKFKNLL